MAVGAPFAVLVAEQAWRDEGTSAHYRPPAPWSHLPADLANQLIDAFSGLSKPVLVGPSWTTDAPYRETRTAIAAAEAEAEADGIVCVEVEAAAL